MEYLLVICSLLGIIGLIFLTYYATKWLNKKFRSTGWNGPDGGIKIVDCIGVAQDRQILVIRAGNKAMLIGVTSGSMTKLADLDESDMLMIEKPGDSASDKGFLENLKRVIAGKSAGEETADAKQEDGYGENDKDDF